MPPSIAPTMAIRIATAKPPGSRPGISSRAITPTTVPISTHSSIERSRSEEHTSELQSLMRISYAVFCLKKKTKTTLQQTSKTTTLQTSTTSFASNTPTTIHTDIYTTHNE